MWSAIRVERVLLVWHLERDARVGVFMHGSVIRATVNLIDTSKEAIDTSVTVDIATPCASFKVNHAGKPAADFANGNTLKFTLVTSTCKSVLAVCHGTRLCVMVRVRESALAANVGHCARIEQLDCKVLEDLEFVVERLSQVVDHFGCHEFLNVADLSPFV